MYKKLVPKGNLLFVISFRLNSISIFRLYKLHGYGTQANRNATFRVLCSSAVPNNNSQSINNSQLKWLVCSCDMNYFISFLLMRVCFHAVFLLLLLLCTSFSCCWQFAFHPLRHNCRVDFKWFLAGAYTLQYYFLFVSSPIHAATRKMTFANVKYSVWDWEEFLLSVQFLCKTAVMCVCLFIVCARCIRSAVLVYLPIGTSRPLKCQLLYIIIICFVRCAHPVRITFDASVSIVLNASGVCPLKNAKSNRNLSNLDGNSF